MEIKGLTVNLYDNCYYFLKKIELFNSYQIQRVQDKYVRLI